MKKIFEFKVNDQGKIPVELNEHLRDYFYSRKTKNIRLTIEDMNKLKTTSQLAFWFAIVVPIFSKHTGYTEKEVHAILKYKAGYVETKDFDGEKAVVIKSLADADVFDMMGIMNSAMEWADYLGINLPEPDPNWKELQKETRNKLLKKQEQV